MYVHKYSPDCVVQFLLLPACLFRLLFHLLVQGLELFNKRDHGVQGTHREREGDQGKDGYLLVMLLLLFLHPSLVSSYLFLH